MTALLFSPHPSKCCSQTYPPICGLFTGFYPKLSKIVAPSIDECKNYVARMKLQSVPKRTVQTASKSDCKRQRNACSNYAPIERTALRTRSVTQEKQPLFRTYSRRALYDLPGTLHGDTDRRAHHKRCHPIFYPTYSFSYRVDGKIRLNLPTRGFSAITE